MSRHLHRLLEEQQNQIRQKELLEKPSIEENGYQCIGEMNMKWEKISVVDSLGKWVYSDEYGYCRHSINGCNIIIQTLPDGRTEVGLNELYVKSQNGNYKRIEFTNETFLNIFNSEFGIRKEVRCYGYGVPNEISKDNIIELKPKEFRITINVTYWFQNTGNHANKNYTVLVKNPDEINNKLLFYNPDFNNKTSQMVIFNELKEGKKLYLVGIGTVEVKELYDYPSKDNIICSVIDAYGRTRDISYEGQTYDGEQLDLLELPLDTKEKETSIFNDSLEELSLQPCVINEGQTYNVYWQGIEEASQYIIQLYKIIDFRCKKKVYHLSDYTVDRNSRIFTINNLVGKNFVFVVKAEDRSGNIIASSRGLSNGEPKFW